MLSSDEQSETHYRPAHFSEPEIESQPEIKKMPKTKPKWRTSLELKSKATVDSYKPHIIAFIKAKGDGKTFVQEDINDYFAQLKNDDESKP